jgi:nucleotide-binding universal stress UspA family protein
MATERAEREPRGRVVVGVDRDDREDEDRENPSGAALLWAATEAARRGADLDVVHVWQPPSYLSPLGIPYPVPDVAPWEARAKALLEDAVSSIPHAVRAEIPLLSPISLTGSTGAALVDTARGADVLVVGSRGHRALRGLLGSVSHQCLHHASCPVVVVPPDADEVSKRPRQRIVVGVDGSDGAAAALRWAMHEAARWDAALSVVHTWETPYPVEPWGFVVTPADPDAFREGSVAMIRSMVDAAVDAGTPRPAVVTELSVEDAAGPGLVGAAADADLLVVGSRGRGGFAALVVGSVSLHCVHAAPCPVAVIPERAATA